MVNDGGQMADGDGFFYKPSMVEPYVGQQWFSDVVVSEIMPPEKQATQASLVEGESVSNIPYSLPPDISYEAQSWSNKYMETMYRFENWAAQWTARDTSFAITGDSNRPNEDAGELFRNDLGSSVSQVTEDCDRGVRYMGNIETSSNLVTDCGNGMLMPMSQPTTGTIQSTTNLPFTLIDPSYVGVNGGVTSTVSTFGKGIHSGLYFDNGSSTGLSMSQAVKYTLPGVNCSNTVNECGTTKSDYSFHRVNGNIAPTGYTGQTDHSFDGVKGNIKSSGSGFRKGINTGVSKARSNKKGDSIRRSGVYAAAMEALARPVSSYSLLYEQPSCLTSEIPSKTKMEAQRECKLEKKLVKKGKLKGQLTNVRGLTGTGMLDGVTVHYVSPSGKVPGIIKGSSYLCGCGSCKYSKEVNAYEFEHHAGRKTSHPNNHIQFETGKTIFQMVQELKRTPESMVFDVIQTYIGSPINQEAFLAWKEKFQQANHEKGADRSSDSMPKEKSV